MSQHLGTQFVFNLLNSGTELPKAMHSSPLNLRPRKISNLVSRVGAGVMPTLYFHSDDLFQLLALGRVNKFNLENEPWSKEDVCKN
jgi:hypothetical protein